MHAMHQVFDNAILFCILVSSVGMASASASGLWCRVSGLGFKFRVWGLGRGFGDVGAELPC